MYSRSRRTKLLHFVVVCMLCVIVQPEKIEPIDDKDPGTYSMQMSERTCTRPSIEEKVCHQYRRTYSGYCTNDRFKFDGSFNSDQFSYFPPSVKPLDPLSLPSARMVSEIVSVQNDLNGDIPNKYGLTDFVTFFSQFLDHNLFHTGIDMNVDMPIPIPETDSLLANFSNATMPFKRSKITCSSTVENTKGFPVNCLTSAIDLTGVYGVKNMTVRALRTKRNGKLKVGGKIYLPLISKKVNVDMTIPHPKQFKNVPKGKLPLSYKRNFFAAGDARANENIVLSSLHTIFMREHNRLAKLVTKRVPKTELGSSKSERSDAIFELAKRLNEAQFQKVVVEEYFPVMTSRALGDISYDSSQSPKVSNVFSTAAFRVGHTMVGNEVELRGPDGAVKETLPIANLFFKKNKFLRDRGVDDVIRGAVYHRAQEIDTFVVHALKGHLFINVEGERSNQDLVALNLQRGRDHLLPSFADIRDFFGQGRIRSFADISSNTNVQALLDSAYERVELVEAWVGMVAEDQPPKQAMGKTITEIWEREFTRVLKGDRFNYKETGSYDPRIKKYMKSEYDAIVSGTRTMKEIILSNTGITKSQLPDSLWIIG